MKRHIFILGILALFIGCSDVAFRSIPSESCENFNGEEGNSCVVSPNAYHYKHSFNFGQIDILFVNDNSGSMYVEQREMANRFQNFMNQISVYDYRIAMITTDVSATPNNSTPRAANGNGAFQDGKFLEFTQNGNGSGYKIIDRDTPNAVALFSDTVKRRETLACENGSYRRENCPSDDERGIYAVNMAVDRGHSGFFRSNTHLAVVFLSDEDERGQGGLDSQYPIEDLDRPETLVSKINSQLGSTKSVSFHSIIIRPGDSSCLNNQYYVPSGAAGPVIGRYGYSYRDLTVPSADLKSRGNIRDGILGNICATNYTTQLSQIGANIGAQTKTIDLQCAPKEGTLDVGFSPSAPGVSWSVNGKKLTLTPEPSIRTEVTIEYDCDPS